MEVRQLRYVVTLAEELHFGRAAAREHIVQSALSQQIRRLEREVGVPLFSRTTHRVTVTPAGALFLVEARRILAHLDRAVEAARALTPPASVLRVGLGDPSFDSMPQVLETLQAQLPDVEIHRLEAGVPEQCRLLAAGRLDIGIGRASLVPEGVAMELIRLDRVGVMVASAHPYAVRPVLPVRCLRDEQILLAEADRSPEYNAFVVDLCRSAGFTPNLYRGTVQSMRGAVDLVARRRCVVCVASSCGLPAGVVWVPLIEPAARYPWSLIWREGCELPVIEVIRECARALAAALGWLSPDAPASTPADAADRGARASEGPDGGGAVFAGGEEVS